MTRAPWGPWRFVATVGVVSLLADVSYEGARSILGPYLGSLGLTAAAIGLVTGAGEALGFAGRLASGPLADRTRAYWPLMLGGYALTVVSVPLLGATSVVWIVVGLVLAERAGKALRRPAKDVILSQATATIGRGRGFAVHEALDQSGAVLGPLAVAGAFAVTGRYAPTFAILAIPGAAVIVLLLWLRRKVPEPSVYEADGPDPAAAGKAEGLGRSFWSFAVFVAATTVGFTTFGVVSYHLVRSGLVSEAAVPVVYAIGMAVDALAALAVGPLLDRLGRPVLLAIPILVAAIPPLAFSESLPLAISGAMVWATVLGIQESAMRAVVAELVPSRRRGTAYGVFAGVLGAAALAGGSLTGALYDVSIPLLIGVVAGIQAVAVVVYAVGVGRRRAGVA